MLGLYRARQSGIFPGIPFAPIKARTDAFKWRSISQIEVNRDEEFRIMDRSVMKIVIGGLLLSGLTAAGNALWRNYSAGTYSLMEFMIWFWLICLGFVLGIWFAVNLLRKSQRARNFVVPLLSLATPKDVTPNKTPNETETIVVGHSKLATWNLIANAKKRVLLHAAFYPTYSPSEHLYGPAWDSALKNTDLKLEVLFVDDNAPWLDEFARVLRQKEAAMFKSSLRTSRLQFLALKEKYSKQVFLYNTGTLPLVPMVVVDDFIFVGHYAHSPVYAPIGYWLRLKSDVGKLLEWTKVPGEPPETATETEKACFRYIAEFVHAKEKGTQLPVP
jgi:hypothetical protein